MTLTITLPGTDEHLTLTPNEERRRAQSDTPDTLLDASHNGIRACAAITDSQYDVEVTALDGRHRDKAKEKAVRSRLQRELDARGYDERSAKARTEEALSSFRSALS